MELTNASQQEDEAVHLVDNATVINSDDEDNVHEIRERDRDGEMLCSRHGKSTGDELGDGSSGCMAGGQVKMEAKMDDVKGGGEYLGTKTKQEVDRNVDEEVWKEDRGCEDECNDDKNDNKENVLVDLEEGNLDLCCDENAEDSRRQRKVSMSRQKAYDRARKATRERDASRLETEVYAQVRAKY